MNVKFRKGKKYRFSLVSNDSPFISGYKLIYLGYDSTNKRYMFCYDGEYTNEVQDYFNKFKKLNALGQRCPKDWIDNRLVTYEEVK